MILSLFLALLIGLSLGLMGGGGSILTVPILIYILDMEPKTAIALSLAIVGLASLFGSVYQFKRGNVDLKVAAIFTPSAMIGTFTGAKASVLLSSSLQLVIFAIVMLLASYFMFKSRPAQEHKKETLKNQDGDSIFVGQNIPLIIIEGLVVGVLTGVVGVGGGFLIVPALVLLGDIPMKKAIGTSLLVITFKSFSGFIGYIDIIEIPWFFLLKFSTLTILGILLGTYLVKFIPAQKLKKSFSIFLVFMACFILYKNVNVFTGLI